MLSPAYAMRLEQCRYASSAEPEIISNTHELADDMR